jgi:hypothetical protein
MKIRNAFIFVAMLATFAPCYSNSTIQSVEVEGVALIPEVASDEVQITSVLVNCGDYAAGYADGVCNAVGGCSVGTWYRIVMAVFDDCAEL